MNPQIYFDLDEYSDAAYMAVPEGIRKKINLSGIANVPPMQNKSHSSTTHQSMQYQPPFVAPTSQPQDMDDLGQDIPF